MSSHVINAWTDHPVFQLGDINGELGPIRECMIVSYDGNLYCKVIVEGINLTISRRYVYKEPGHHGTVPSCPRHELEKLPRASL